MKETMVSKKEVQEKVQKVVTAEGLGNCIISVRGSIPHMGQCWNHIEKDKYKIVLHTGLFQSPEILKKYCEAELWEVVLHELAHLKYFSHGDSFWKYYEYLKTKYSDILQ